MAETTASTFTVGMSNSSVLKVLRTSVDLQSYDSEFQAEGQLSSTTLALSPAHIVTICRMTVKCNACW